jgi:uncharacterized protein (TIGR02466 family)
VRGTDAEVTDNWRLLFGTPLYSALLADHESLNTRLLRHLGEEAQAQVARRRGGGDAARSLVGNGWRTDDLFLQRGDPAIRDLHRQLLHHAEMVTQYGQSRKLPLRLHLSGWAVSIGPGGSMREHVHPLASWSGVYYLSAGRASGSGGGCLRLSDPRPGAAMVTLGPNDSQFSRDRQVCPRAGLLVLFPSWVAHSVVPLDPSGEALEQHGIDGRGQPSSSTSASGHAPEDGGEKFIPLHEQRVAVAFNVHGAE